MLINNSNVAGLQEETAAAVDNALCTISVAMVLIFRPATIGVFAGILKIDMALWQPVRVGHFGPWCSGKQNV